MKSIGIIAEYNPFHNGHLYMIRKIKKRYPEHLLVCALNGNFMQRGEPAIVDKYQRSKWAIKNGIDIVVEIPFCIGTQRADVFAKGSIDILNYFMIDILICGIEKNYFKKKDIINIDDMPPNYKLYYFYDKAIKERKYNIKIETVIREENKIDKENINKQSPSATFIRKLIFYRDWNKIYNLVPANVYNDLFNYNYKYGFIEEYYNFLKYQILIEDNINKDFALCSDGIINNLKKNLINSEDFFDFFNKSHKKHFSKSHLRRVLTYILCKISYNILDNAIKNPYIEILAINKKGMNYINYLNRFNNFKKILKTQKQKDIFNMLCYKNSTNLYELLTGSKKNKNTLIFT